MDKIGQDQVENNETKRHPIMLCILDGWGERAETDGNAIYHAQTPNWDRMSMVYPNTQLKAAELDVGLPLGQMGNSEVGHMNLGAGRIVMQDLPIIDKAVLDDSLRKNPTLVDVIFKTRQSGGTCHLLGLVSPGGVHSHQNHLVALAKILDSKKVPIKLHAFLDGRDTAQSGGIGFLNEIIEQTKTLQQFSIATIAGRYWAMDRDNNWDRTRQAYNAIAEGEGLKASDPLEVIQNNYDGGITDEFIMPNIIGHYQGVTDGDSILMFNFRSDRARQLISSFVDPNFDQFEKKSSPNLTAQASMTEYSSHLGQFVDALFPQRQLEQILGKVVSDAGLTQLRAAETEKYAHVTFFFNGGREKIFPGEERILIPSPKVKTYDLQPEMAAYELTESLIEAIEKEKFDLIIANFANCDMVGHTGKFEAAVKAVETIDVCLERLEKALLNIGGTLLITADHGNVEQMCDKTSKDPHTAHTVSKVPLIMVNPPSFVKGLQAGMLADVSPTLLRLLDLNQPEEMTGNSLIIEKQTVNARV